MRAGPLQATGQGIAKHKEAGAGIKIYRYQQLRITCGVDNGVAPADQLTDTNEPFIWEGADYANLRISDIYTPRQYQTSMIDRAKVPRMPWHDIAVQIRGESVIDLVRHFVQYWNFVNFQNKLNDRELLIQAGIAPSEEMV